MVLTQAVILVDAEEMELWRLKHPNESFSAWVRACITRDVRPDVQPVGIQHTTDSTENVVRCKNNRKFHGIKVTKAMCDNCGTVECDERLE